MASERTIMVEQVNDGIVRLRLGYSRASTCTWSKSRTGSPSWIRGSSCTERPSRSRWLGGRSKRILLTHFHPDHSGSAAYLQRVTGAPVYVHEADEPFVSARKWLDEEPGWGVTRSMFA